MTFTVSVMSPLQTTTQLLSSLGVNTHIEYTDGKYASSANVIADLRFLGITHVRDAVLNSSNQGQGSYDALAAAGVKFDLYFQGTDIASSFKLVDAFLARHPGAISTIEGPNEVNNFPISYGGQRGDSAAVAYQNALYTAAHADKSLQGVPVANLTSYPDLAGAADLANFHSYPKGGAEPAATLAQDSARQAAAEPGRPIIMTEGGYSTLLSANYKDGVDEATQAKLTLNLFLDNAKAGVSQSYVYELLDAYADPAMSDSEKHYGLFHLDNTPKPAATAIHNLTTVLSTGSDVNAAATPLAFSISGPGAVGSSLLLTKSATVHDLVVWSEPTLWNGKTGTPVTAGPQTIRVHLDAPADVAIYDPLVASAAVQTLHGVQDLSVSVVDHPVIIEVTTLAAAKALSSSVVSGVAAPALPPAAAAQSIAAVSHARSTGSDFDGDGKADVLWRSEGGDTGLWVSSKGLGDASWTPLSHVSSDWHMAGVGDFDGDGKADVLWRSDGGDTGLWISSKGLGDASWTPLSHISSDWHIAGVGDFDGDGKADVLWRSDAGDTGLWVSSKGLGDASWTPLSHVSSDWHMAGVGDFDGDGKADVLWRSDGGDTGLWISSKGLGDASWTPLSHISSDWHIAGVGDFDGDGKADVLWRSDAGDTGLWVSSKGLGDASWTPLSHVSSDWHMAGVGDFDGDGKADVLWRSDGGDTGLWISSKGLGDASWTPLSHVSSDWHMSAFIG